MTLPVAAPPELAAVRLLARTGADLESEDLRSALEACDPLALGYALSDQQLLALLGTRALVAWGPEQAPPVLVEAVASSLATGRSRGLALEAISAELVDRLAAAGVRSLVLKGPLLARRLHGDVGYRASNDIDLLVGRGDLDGAARALAPLGYAVDQTIPVRSHGLPDLHTVLTSPTANLPRIDLHWRVHWYETDFSADLLARSQRTGLTFLEPESTDDLATLMLLYARDGFYGLRKAVDIAGWWELNHSATSRPLERHWRDYPRLRRAFTAAALAAERAVGVPAAELLPESAEPALRPRLAANLASWNQTGKSISSSPTWRSWTLS